MDAFEGIFKSLSQEHRLLEKLLLRLDQALELGEKEAKTEIQGVLLVLFPALKKHEEIEDSVLDSTEYPSKKGAKELLALVGRQHEQIQSFRKEIMSLLQDSSRLSPDHLRPLVLKLIGNLRLHFLTEENRLWPHYQQAMSRSLSRSLGRRLRDRVKALGSDIQKREALVGEYLSRGVR